MVDDINIESKSSRLGAKTFGIMAGQAFAVLLSSVIGLYLFLLYFGNGVKAGKLTWYVLTHWTSFATIFVTPVWLALAFVSMLLGVVLVYEILQLIRRPLSGHMPHLKKILLGAFLLVATPLLTILADTGQAWVMKNAFNYNLKMYVLNGIQNDYERWFRKTFTSATEKQIHRDLLVSFRYHFRAEELEILEDDIAANTKQVDWWYVEYPELVAVVEKSPRRVIGTTYRAASTGNREGTLKVSIGQDNAVVLQLAYGIDKTLPDMPNVSQVTTVMRDNDRDGVPDEFQTIPKIEWGYTGPVTLDGFIPLSRKAPFDVVYGLWAQGIGYAVNFFLHGYDSTLPRETLPVEDNQV